MADKFDSFNYLMAELCCTALFDKGIHVAHNDPNDSRFTDLEMREMLMYVNVVDTKTKAAVGCIGIQDIDYNTDGSFKVIVRFYPYSEIRGNYYSRNTKYGGFIDTVVLNSKDLFSLDADTYKFKVRAPLIKRALELDFPPYWIAKILGSEKPFPSNRRRRYNKVCQRFIKEAVKQSSYQVGFVDVDGSNKVLFDYGYTTVYIQWPFLSNSQITITDKNKTEPNNYPSNHASAFKEKILDTSFTDSKISIFSRYSKESVALEFQPNGVTLPTSEESHQEQTNTPTTKPIITPMKNIPAQSLLKLININYTEEQNSMFFDKEGAWFKVTTKDQVDYVVNALPVIDEHKDHTYIGIGKDDFAKMVGFPTDELETMYNNLVEVAVGIGWPEELAKSVFRQYKEIEATEPVKSSEDSFKSQAAKLIRKVTALVEVRGCYIFGINDWVSDIVVINKKNNTFSVFDKTLNNGVFAEFLCQENIATVFKEEADKIKKECQEKLHELTYHHFDTLEEAIKVN
jgi:hypothetical protein